MPVLDLGCLVGIGIVPVGLAGYLREGEPEGLFVEDAGRNCPRGDCDHLGPVGLEGLLAVPVGTGDDTGLPAGVPAGAGGVSFACGVWPMTVSVGSGHTGAFLFGTGLSTLRASTAQDYQDGH